MFHLRSGLLPTSVNLSDGEIQLAHPLLFRALASAGPPEKVCIISISNNAVQTFSGGLVYHFYVFVLGGIIDVLKNASKVHTVFVTKLQET